jgi:hypothetical protein
MKGDGAFKTGNWMIELARIILQMALDGMALGSEKRIGVPPISEGRDLAFYLSILSFHGRLGYAAHYP